MVVLFALGVMSVLWMAVIAGVIFAEEGPAARAPASQRRRAGVGHPRDLGGSVAGLHGARSVALDADGDVRPALRRKGGKRDE
jgi:hypothetical protein